MLYNFYFQLVDLSFEKVDSTFYNKRDCVTINFVIMYCCIVFLKTYKLSDCFFVVQCKNRLYLWLFSLFFRKYRHK